MEAIEELSQLSDSMRQAASLLADEDVDENSSSSASSRRDSTFLNVVALGNVVSESARPISHFFFVCRLSFVSVLLCLVVWVLVLPCRRISFGSFDTIDLWWISCHVAISCALKINKCFKMGYVCISFLIEVIYEFDVCVWRTRLACM